ncbi:MAG: zf-HC2 domain-containing protein [Ilumatobacteraceae bacterium]
MNLTHLDEQLLIGYCELSVTAATAAAIEAHLMTCASCRAELADVAALADDGPLDQQSVWDGVLERVDRPTRSITERLLGVMRVRPDTAKLLATTPALRLAWLAAVVFVAAFAAAAARFDGDGPWLLLVIAPLLPVAGVATAYGPALDPTYEIGVAAPMSGLRLTMLRTLAVIATTIPLLAVGALVAPGGGWTVFGWVLPSFALVAMTLALSTVISPERAGVVVGVGWMVALVVLIDRAGTGDFVDRSLIFSPSGQTTVAVAAAIGVTIAATRKACFDVMTVSGGGR